MVARSDSGIGSPADAKALFSSISFAPTVGVASGAQSGGRTAMVLFGCETACRIESARTARSGVGNAGICAAFKSMAPCGARAAAPVRATTIGRSRTLRVSTNACAIFSTSFPVSTQKHAMMASTWGSAATSAKHFSKRPGSLMTAAVTSTGLVAFP
ncbi:unannotated protein [freshwater metagenome]|uniref:Unannotated protein n=1 Tax=freshwater metagenome TaxID=449393 RepID=A0A6J6Q4I4_9ZZZZ